MRYLDLIFNGGTQVKSAWMVELSSQTERTGTVADFFRSLGVGVTEVDLDEDDDEDFVPQIQAARTSPTQAKLAAERLRWRRGLVGAPR